MKKVECIGWSLLAMIIITSCSSTKNLQQVAQVPLSKDSAKVVNDSLNVINDSSNNAVDTLAAAKNIVTGLLKNRISFNTFSAKVDVTYKDNEVDEDANLSIRMEKDSIIWFSLTGPFGIEGLRAIITEDSVHIINRLEKEVQHESIRYISKILKIPVTISILQDIILGNPVFVYEVSSYRTNAQDVYIQTIGQLLSNMLTVQNSDYKMLHSKIIDRDTAQFRVLDLDYSNYDASKGVYFAKQRSINVTDKNMLQVVMDFRQYNFDQAQSYPFNIPKSYDVK